MLHILNRCIVSNTEPSEIGIVLITDDVDLALDKAIKLRDEYQNNLIDNNAYIEKDKIIDICTEEHFAYHHILECGEEYILQLESTSGEINEVSNV